MREVIIDGSALTVEDVVAVASRRSDGATRAGRPRPDGAQPVGRHPRAQRRRARVRRQHRIRCARRYAGRRGGSDRAAGRDHPVARGGHGGAARRRRGTRAAPAAGQDADRRVFGGARRPAAPPAGVPGPGPAAGHPRQGLGGRVRRPGPARPPGAAADRGGAAARARATAGGTPGGGCSGRARPGAAAARPQGGPVPGQRHRADAGGARVLGARRARCWCRPPTWPAPCPSRRCSAPTGPTTSGFRRCGRTRASSTARRTCGALLAGLAAAGQPPAQPARGAGRLLPALRAPGARRRPRRPHLRPARARDRAGLGRGQPDHHRRRRGDDHRQLPRRAAGLRRGHAGHGARRAGQHQ